MEFRYRSASANLTINSMGGAVLTSVWSGNRGQGEASKLLDLICEYADAHRLMLILTVRCFDHSKNPKLTDAQLVEFYSRHGFLRTDKDIEPIRMYRPLS